MEKSFTMDDPQKILYHLDISACASQDINNMLFNLLFSRHVETPNKKSFNVADHMGFLIEIPTELSGIHALNVLTKNVQNKHGAKARIAKPMEFPLFQVTRESNIFDYDYVLRKNVLGVMPLENDPDMNHHNLKLVIK